MGKTIIIFQGNDNTPILDSITVTATQDFAPYSVYPGTIIGSGNDNGSRVFSDCIDGEYTIKYDGNVQNDLNPLFIAGPGGTVQAIIGQTSITDYYLADDAVTTDKIINDAVTTDKIVNNAVTAAKIAAGAVDGTGLASESVLKSKLGTSIFNTIMEDNSGWGPKFDGITISTTNGDLYVIDGGIDTNQLATDAVTAAKIADRAVTTIKVGTGAITEVELADASVDSNHIKTDAVGQTELATDSVIQSKIYAGAVGTEELEDAGVTAAKIADQNVTADKLVDASIPIEKLDTSLANSMLRFASKVVYVSPEYSDNVSPYFDNIADAYADVGSDQGTILLYPGTYTTQITMAESVNIIGIDKLRCIIEIDPPAGTPYGIKLSATSKDVLFKNFTLKVEPSFVLGVTTYGIWLDSPGSNWIRMEDLLIKVQPAGHAVTAVDTGIGFYINEANFVIQNCLVQAYGGNYLTADEDGDIEGVFLSGTTIGTIFNSQFAVRNKGGGANWANGIYWTDTNQDVIIDNCTIEVTETGSGNEYAFAAGAAITALLMGTLYSKTEDGNVTITNVESAENSNVEVRGTI